MRRPKHVVRSLRAMRAQRANVPARPRVPPQRSGSWIRTFKGKKFYPLDPAVEDIEIEDIAHALSNLCRFTGHCEAFYSVAEHSVRVARWLEENGHADQALVGLLHDATEAYLNDVSTPIKLTKTFYGYRAAEDRLWRAIARRFGVPVEMETIVKVADRVLLVTEARDLLTNTEGFEEYGVEPIKKKIEPWDPSEAKDAFLQAFRRLY